MIENKHYNWEEVEKKVLATENKKNFNGSIESENNPFCMIMPPPNVTGYLHVGHALVTSLQDSLARYKRMKGYNVKWQAGLDHAGIATQVIVEKQLAEQGISRHDISREEFLQKAYDWKEHSGSKILSQLSQLGSSIDDSYVAFTMDDQSIKGVNHAFVTLYNQGLIYQDYRLVNWDSKLQTAISDLEVEQKEIKGKFYYLKYYIEGSKNYVVIATTRPETLFGDTAVAVNEEDERYKDIIGKNLIVPICNRKIKVITDEHADATKGSGAVKITPAHDFNDFEVGQRNNLESINILNKNGTLNNNVPEDYQGLSVQAARKKVLENLESLELIEKIEDTKISVPYGDRSGVVVEPLLTKQWFLKAEVLAEKAMEVVKNKEIRFHPENWQNVYFRWLEDIKPWCISRQLIWGHRIPVWYSKEDNKVFVAKTSKEAQSQAYQHYGRDVELVQDPDVLDTWFSSGLWPFLTLGWPEKTKELETFFPTSTLVTAFDIIFFWVARMIMFSTHFLGKVPFKDIYINPLVRDEKGQKMSKSKGNVVDPLDLMKKYGTDALRYTILSQCTQGRDIRLSEKIVETGRNFITKIWNSYKFCNQNGMTYNENFDISSVQVPINIWILEKLQTLEKSVDENFDSYRFSDISLNIYNFIWKDFCDWYLELSKPYFLEDAVTNQSEEVKQVMGFVFYKVLQLSHPIMPFITKYLFEHLCGKDISSYLYKPINFKTDKTKIESVNKTIELISEVRKIKTDLNIPASKEVPVSIKAQEAPNFIEENLFSIKKMAKVTDITCLSELTSSMIEGYISGYSFGISVSEYIDINNEVERIQKLIEKLTKEKETIGMKVNNEKFLQHADPEVIDTFKKSYEELSTKVERNNYILNKIKNITV